MNCLVLLSGGQDSATCLAWARRKFKELHTIAFDYGQRHKIELKCSKDLSRLAEAKSHLELPFPSLAHLGDSALIAGGDISSHHRVSESLPASFVPGRNYMFLGLAAAHAVKLGVTNLVTGVCQTDFSGYPDCRDRSIKAVQVALFLCLDYDVTIYTPLMWKTKAETVKLMQELDRLDWYAYTHTCYEGAQPPCMECPACILRIKGFKEVGVKDPLVERFLS